MRPLLLGVLVTLHGCAAKLPPKLPRSAEDVQEMLANARASADRLDAWNKDQSNPAIDEWADSAVAVGDWGREACKKLTNSPSVPKRRTCAKMARSVEGWVRAKRDICGGDCPHAITWRDKFYQQYVTGELTHELEVCELEAKLAELLGDTADVVADLQKRVASLGRRLKHQQTVGAAMWDFTSSMMGELNAAMDRRAERYGEDDGILQALRGGAAVQYAEAFERILVGKGDPTLDLELLERLLSDGKVHVNDIVNTPSHGSLEPLVVAGGACRAALVHLLLKFGADVSQTGGPQHLTALLAGSQCDVSKVAAALIVAGANPDQRSSGSGGGETALMFAASKGQMDTVALLLQAGAKTHLRCHMGLTAADWAVKRRQRAIVKLLEKHARSEPAPTADEERWVIKNTLIAASMQGDVRKVRELLASGAEVDKRNAEGHSAIHLAAEAGHAEVIRVLLSEAGAAINRVATGQHDGVTALHLAASEVQHEAVSVLLEGGADVDAATAGGLTPLMLAIMQAKDIYKRGHKIADVEHVVQQLLDVGADTKTPSKAFTNGKSAVALATMCGGDCAGILRRIRARDGGREGTGRERDDGRTNIHPLRGSTRVRDSEQHLFTTARYRIGVLMGGVRWFTDAAAGDVDALEALLEEGGFDMDTREPRTDGTALMFAVKNERLDAVRLLVDAGVDVNAVDNVGFTAVMLAATGHGDFRSLKVKRGQGGALPDSEATARCWRRPSSEAHAKAGPRPGRSTVR